VESNHRDTSGIQSNQLKLSGDSVTAYMRLLPGAVVKVKFISDP
jgi:hypothetical protein